MEEIKTENKKSKLVFDGRVCRALLKRGERVIDCKPLRTNKEYSVLVFEVSPTFQAAFDEITAEIKAKDETKHSAQDNESEQLHIQFED